MASRYQYQADLGAGAQGRVVRVLDRALGATVALKAVPATARAALVREFSRLATLAHPTLPRVRDVGLLDEAVGPIAAGTTYYTADELDGTTLAAAAPLDAAGLWTVAADVAAALALLHGVGLVHCDVAPANIMLVGVGAERRAVLIDLGLAGEAAVDAARGTPHYLAPEALTGRVHPRGDLYGLGACLFFAARGVAPVGGDGAALVAAILRAPRPSLRDAEAPGLAGLIDELLALDAAARPPSALAVFARVQAARAALSVTVAPRTTPPAAAPRALADTWRALEPVIAAVAARCAEARAGVTAPPLVVTGPIGSDARAVIAHGVRRDQIAATLAGAAPLVAAPIALDDAALATGTDEQRGRALATRALATAAARAGTVAVLDVSADERAPAVLAAHGAIAGPAAVFVAIETNAAVIASGPVVALAPASRDELAALATAACGEVDAAWLDGLARASRGLPNLALAIITALGADGDDPRRRDPEAATVSERAAVLARVLLADDATAAVATVLALWRDRVDDALLIAATGRDRATVATAQARLVELGAGPGDALAPAVADAVRAALAPDAIASRARALYQLARDRGVPPARCAGLLLALPLDADLAARALVEAEAALARGAPRQALQLAEHVGDAPRAALLAARAALVLGDYPRARAALARADGDAAQRTAARLVAARVAQRAGDLAGAEAILDALIPIAPADAELHGARARLLVARGRYRDAIATVAAVEPVPATAAGALCAEARATAHLYLGELDLAGVHVTTALAIGQATGDDAVRARALVVRGMLAQAHGDLLAATVLYRDATAAARLGGDGHCAAVALQNHAAALAERGLHGAALPALAAASAELVGLGKVGELAAVDANRAVSLYACGHADAAAIAADAALARATTAGLPVPRFYARLVQGDLAAGRGDDDDDAAAHYRAAWDDAVAAGLPDRGHAQRGLAEVAPDAATADAALATVAALDSDDDDRARTLLARGRVARRGLATEPLPPLVAGLTTVAERARDAGRHDRAWRALAIAAALATTVDDPAAATLAARARAGFDELVAATPEPWRAGLMTDRDLAAITALATPAPAVVVPVAAAPTDRLRRLLGLARRLSADVPLARILDEVIDAAIELTGGERAFVLLRNDAEPDAPLEVAAARGFVTDALTPTAISRSIAHRAIASGEAVVTVDAGADERFDGAASITALRLRSVVAVPLLDRGAVLGCLYVDHRVRTSAFDDHAAATLTELAALAAVAIAAARLVARARRDAEAIAALNARLAAEIAERDAELVVVRAAAPTRPRRAGLDAIVGESPAIVAVLGLIERAAQVALPVAIAGESGTGKELCARAVHDAGPRRDRPFVAINCGALPEALLESELFGHVKGAFTGADRERKGLFEIADGGTLFLDEIADTSPGLQAKLLRVVQDGVVRRVGDERTRKVEVRLVTAARVPLAELVTAGRFRDDLRYRLDVIAITLPPLRTRATDLPALIAHLLARIAGDRPPPRVSKDASRALARYAWPGNIRELENALARAVALGSDPITVDDLPEALRGPGVAAPRFTPDGELTLKPAIDGLERAYVAAALARANGNQSAAARLLGLSRFGLQKKLRRLGLDAR